MLTDNNYDADYYQWTNTQAELLRSGNLSDADIDNIAEEIESMGKREKRELISRLKILMVHLLKWEYQPSFQSKSWQSIIKEQRLEIHNHLEDNPSLQTKLAEIISRSYSLAIIKAGRETGLDESVFPQSCPYSFLEVMEKKVTFKPVG